MAKTTVTWEELPQEIRDSIPDKNLIMVFQNLGGKFVQTVNAKKGVRYFAQSKDGSSRTRIDIVEKMAERISKIISNIQKNLIQNSENWGPHADTSKANQLESFAVDYVQKLLRDCPYLDSKDFQIAWVKGTETPFLISSFLYPSEQELTPRMADTIHSNLAKSWGACHKTAKAILKEVGKNNIRNDFVDAFRLKKQALDTQNYAFLDICSVEDVRVQVNDIFKPFYVSATVILENNTPCYLTATVSPDLNIPVRSRIKDAIENVDFQPVLKIARVKCGSKMAAFIDTIRTPGGSAKQDSVSVTVQDAIPEMDMGQYLVYTEQESNRFELPTQNNTEIRFHATKSGYKRNFIYGLKENSHQEMAERIAEFISESKFVKAYPYHYTISVYSGSELANAFDFRIESGNQAIVARNNVPINPTESGANTIAKSIASGILHSIIQIAGDLLFQIAFENGQTWCVFSKKPDYLTRELFFCILDVSKDLPNGFMKKDVWAKFQSRPCASNYSKEKVADALNSLLDSSIRDVNGAFEDKLFVKWKLTDAQFPLFIYFLRDVELAKSAADHIQNIHFHFTDLADVKTTKRATLFETIIQNISSPEEAFKAVNRLSMLSKKDAAAVIHSKEFSHILSLLKPEDKSFAAVTIKNIPGCTTIAKQLIS